jgi:hypothetical protein
MSNSRVPPKSKAPHLAGELPAQAEEPFVARISTTWHRKHQPEFWCDAPNLGQWQEILVRNLPFWQEKIAELNRFLRGSLGLLRFLSDVATA